MQQDVRWVETGSKSGMAKLPLLQRPITAEEPLCVVVTGSKYWPFPKHIFRFLDDLVFLLGDPHLLEVWHNDSYATVDEATRNWHRNYAPPDVGRREFFTDWGAPCRPQCSHDRTSDDCCPRASYYRDKRIIDKRPDFCKAWVCYDEEGFGVSTMLGLARRTRLPHSVTAVRRVGLDQFERAPECQCASSGLEA